MSRGKLLVLEGTDGSGKSTQTNLVKQYLEDNNLSFTYYHFPMYGHNQFSDVIARFLRGEFGESDEVDPLFVANIYAMDRFRFLPQLEKDLEENDVVLLDRYVYSNIAYQCAKMESPEDAERMKEWIFEFEFRFLNLPYPDLNIFFDVPMDVTRKRLEAAREGDDRDYLQGKQDVHEASMDFQSAVRNNYISSMNGGINCQIIPCAIAVGTDDWLVLKPEEVLEKYKSSMDYILLGKELI